MDLSQSAGSLIKFRTKGLQESQLFDSPKPCWSALFDSVLKFRPEGVVSTWNIFFETPVKRSVVQSFGSFINVSTLQVFLKCSALVTKSISWLCSVTSAPDIWCDGPMVRRTYAVRAKWFNDFTGVKLLSQGHEGGHLRPPQPGRL